MPRDPRTYLFDIRRTCDLLTEFTHGKALTDYNSDALLRSAVERQFEIIGEVLGQLLKENPRLAPRSSHARQIISFRNRLIHGYATIDDAVVWGVLQTNVPILRREIADLLNADEPV